MSKLKGDGSVYKLKSRDLWACQLILGYDIKTGKQIRKVLYAKTKSRKENLRKNLILLNPKNFLIYFINIYIKSKYQPLKLVLSKNTKGYIKIIFNMLHFSMKILKI